MLVRPPLAQMRRTECAPMDNLPTIFVADPDPAMCESIKKIAGVLELRCESYATGQEFLDSFDGQPDSKIAAEVRSSHRQNLGKLNGIPDKDGDIGGPPPNIDDCRSKIAFIFREYCFGAGKLPEDHFFHTHLSAVDGIDQVLIESALTGHHVNVDVQARAVKPYRILNAVMIVQKEFLRQDVDNFSIRRNGNRLGRLYDLRHILG